MPSIAELCYVYRCKDVVNEAFSKINSLPNGSNLSENAFNESYFWSSSQCSENYRWAWNVNFSNGMITNSQKSTYKSVLVIRTF